MEKIRDINDASCDIFKSKLNQVVDLMLSHQLRSDMDDGLLEKLLGVFENGFTKGALMDMLSTTNLCHLFGSVLQSLLESPEKCSDVDSFTVRTLGIFMRNQNLFLFLQEEEKILMLLSAISKKCSSYSPSLHAALLHCLTSFAVHSDGQKFLISNGCVDAAFSSLCASSYYVRKDAVTFFTSFLMNATLEHHELDIEQHIKSLFELLIATIKEEDVCNEKLLLKENCILILKTCVEKSQSLQVFLCQKCQLLKEMFEVWAKVPNFKKPSENMLQLIADCHKFREKQNDAGAADMVQLLMKHGFSTDAIILACKLFLSEDSAGKLLTIIDLQTVMWPITALSDEGTNLPNDCAVVWEDKSKRISLICASLSSLTKLIHLLDDNLLSYVVQQSCVMLQSSVCDDNCAYPEHMNVVRSKKVKTLLIELLYEGLSTKCFPMIPHDTLFLLMDCIILVIEKTCDCNFTCQMLKLFSVLVQQRIAIEEYLSDSVRMSKFASVLQKRLFDQQWPVVDSSMEIVGVLVRFCKEGIPLWQNLICGHGLPTVVWDMAFASQAEGYVRATSISLITSMCFCPMLFQELKDNRGATKDLVICTLCKLSQHSDVFIQRECISSLVKWLHETDIESGAKIYEVLRNVIQNSLDCQTKLFALNAWKFISGKYLSISHLDKNVVYETLQFLCRIGYGSSLLYAISDSDRIIQCDAIQELLKLRKIMTDVGLNASSLNCDKTASHVVVPNLNGHDSFAFPLINKKERDDVIEEVLDMTTLEQIQNVMRTDMQNFLNSSLDDVDKSCLTLCTVKQLWETIWSNDIEARLELCLKSSDVYVDNPSALLDDIIAAEIKFDIIPNIQVEYQNADCY